MDDEQFRILMRRLDSLNRLVAASAVKGLSFREAVQLLNSVGMQPREIAQVLGKTANSVRVTLFGVRKSKK